MNTSTLQVNVCIVIKKINTVFASKFLSSFYRAMYYVFSRRRSLAISSAMHVHCAVLLHEVVRLSARLSISSSICNVDVPYSCKLSSFENN